MSDLASDLPSSLPPSSYSSTFWSSLFSSGWLPSLAFISAYDASFCKSSLPSVGFFSSAGSGGGAFLNEKNDLNLSPIFYLIFSSGGFSSFFSSSTFFSSSLRSIGCTSSAGSSLPLLS